MAFENLERLEDQLEALKSAAAKQNDEQLRNRIFAFARQVYIEIERAFDDLQGLFSEITNIPQSELNEKRVADLRTKLDYVHSREKFKIVLEVCDQLDRLAKKYRTDIDRVLVTTQGQGFSQLFWLLEKNEAVFRRTIEDAVRNIASELGHYRAGGEITEARSLAASCREKLRDHLDRVRRARIALAGEVHGVDALLVNTRADETLRRSAWFNGSFYLAAAIVLMSLLSVLAGQLDLARFALVVVGSYVGLTLIGAFQLKNDEKLSEMAFLELVQLSMTRVLVPIFGRKKRHS